MLKSKSWRKQTYFKIQFYIRIQLTWSIFGPFWPISASPTEKKQTGIVSASALCAQIRLSYTLLPSVGHTLCTLTQPEMKFRCSRNHHLTMQRMTSIHFHNKGVQLKQHKLTLKMEINNCQFISAIHLVEQTGQGFSITAELSKSIFPVQLTAWYPLAHHRRWQTGTWTTNIEKGYFGSYCHYILFHIMHLP